MLKISSSIHVLFICVLALQAHASDSVRDATPAEIEAIRDAMVKELVDPLSAQFRDVKVSDSNAGTVYGLVNAKNRAGGYVGFYRFLGFLTLTEGKPPRASIVGIDGPNKLGAVADGMCRERGLI
jgi:hypothetical protein